MADHTRAKKHKMSCTIVYPDLTQKTTKTALYKTVSSKTQPPPDPAPLPPMPGYDLAGPSTDYAERVTTEIKAWESVRQPLVTAFYQTQVPADGDTCITCNKEVSLNDQHIRCHDCGSPTYFCSQQCASELHNRKQHIFHKPEIYKLPEQRYVDFDTEIYLSKPQHKCTNGQLVRSGIQVYDPKGRVHTVSIQVCGCEKDCVTFMRHQLWTSSVDRPCIAFHLDLLNWMEYLVLEGKVSLLAICQTIRWKNNLTVSQFNTLYRGIVGESFDEYRHFRYKIRTMDVKIEEEVWCPACPKDSGNKYVSLDGNFGLVRKRNSGKSYVPSKHGDKLFVADESVRGTSVDDEQIPRNTDCSNFQAGTIVRSKNKTANLDVTGVFGSCCRHGVPLPNTFINMDKGEGLGYSVRVINTLLEQITGTDVKLHVLYDIACVLEKHLKNKGDKNLSKVSLAVPIFHVFGHKTACHVNYSTRWLAGYGLTDGEEMERLWSYMRGFAYITKEMTPSHRVDMLTDALLHYRWRKVNEIEMTLTRNVEKAYSIRDSTGAELHAAQLDMSIEVSTIDIWIENEKKFYSSGNEKDDPFSNEEKYVLILQSIDCVNESIRESQDIETRNMFTDDLTRLSAESQKLQRKIGTRKQWRKGDAEYKLHRSSLEKKKKQKMIRQMHKQAMDYRFIQRLMHNYGDGNTIVRRLTTNLTRSTKCLRRSLNLYNKAGFTDQSGGIPDKLSWDEICDPLGDLYRNVERIGNNLSSDTQIPPSERDRLMEVRNKYLRAVEEIENTKREMQCTLDAFHVEYREMLQAICVCEGTEGLIMALKNRAEEVKQHFLRCHAFFSKYIPTRAIPSEFADTGLNEIVTQDIEIVEMEDPTESDEDE